MNNLLLKLSIIFCSLVSILMLISFVVRLNSTPLDTQIHDKTKKRGYNNTIQLNVLNATGEAGIASKTRNHLRKLGFDVVEIGNYDTKLDSTIIIDRLGDKLSSFKLSRAVGLEENKIKTIIDSSLYLRATLVLGNDFSNLRVKL